MLIPADVIIAVASPPGRSLRGIIRLSGSSTYELLRNHLTPVEPDREAAEWMREARAMRLDIETIKLPTIAIIMPAPHSYTGEHCAELQLPGNPTLLERVVDVLLESGKRRGISARRAEPGEFTARAFFNGRMSLTQAEGVAATIAAQSDAELRAAQLLSSGSLGSFAHRLADDLANALALVEAGIDFTDQEDVVAIAPADLHARLINLHGCVEDQLSRSVGMEQIEAIPWVVLVGDPNAGKSALFNALLGRERAVVSPLAGTTRDVLAEPLTIHTAHGPAEVMLIDLAGIDEEEDSMNRLMQSAARSAIDRAELILRCVPVNDNFSNVHQDEILVRTKIDQLLEPKPGQSEAPARVGVSAFTGHGLDDLKALITQRLATRAVSLAADATALRPRHEAALRSAMHNLAEAIELVAPIRRERSLGYPELIASIMRAALDDLAALAGDITPDEVLGRVFATFCVGK